jgi:hypothetical protein
LSATISSVAFAASAFRETRAKTAKIHFILTPWPGYGSAVRSRPHARHFNIVGCCPNSSYSFAICALRARIAAIQGLGSQ